MFEQEYLQQAEADLTRASRRLWALRRQALTGQYDSEEFDRAIITYRTAAQAAQEARAAAAGAGQTTTAGRDASRRAGLQVPPAFVRAFRTNATGPDTPGPEPPTQPPVPFTPTPRMRFVKWLVETGRLSDG